MLAFLKDRFVLLYIVLFASSAWVLSVNGYALEDLLSMAVILGIIFPLIAWIISRNATPLYTDKLFQKNELLILFLVILYITIWLTWGTGWLTRNSPKALKENERAWYLFNIGKKIVIFVLLPYLIYKWRFGFTVKDFGIGYPFSQTFSKKTFLILLVVGVPMLLFQYFMGGGAAPIREGKFTGTQMLVGFPLLFISLLVEVGLVEEFFFRALLQSRITVWLRSPKGGILVSGLIFGLAHFPGLWLRGASSLEGLSPNAGWTAILAIAIVNLSIAGIFLGIIWHYTKNFWLIMIIHALVDLLPNFGEFIKTFHI